MKDKIFRLTNLITRIIGILENNNKRISNLEENFLLLIKKVKRIKEMKGSVK